MTSPTCPARAVAPPDHPDAGPAIRWPDRARLRARIRNMLVAAFLTIPATVILHAEQAPQAWVPEVLEFPADMELQTDRSIGSTLRMFSFSTGHDPETMMATWEDTLRSAGYTILQGQEDILDHAIEFSGPGIGNAKIVVAPATGEGRWVIEFDATLK